MYVYAEAHPDLSDLPFLVDTGAQITMMPLSWYNRIAPENRPKLQPARVRVMAANQTDFRIQR